MTLIDAPSRLSRNAASAYLLASHGLSYAPATLAKLACVGGGPRYFKAGVKPIYPRDELDAWAAEKLGHLVSNTTEAQARNKQATPAEAA